MSTKRKRRGRAARPAVKPWEVGYLLIGDVTGHVLEWVARGPRDPFAPGGHFHRLWGDLRDELLKAWRLEHPGTRPVAWWAIDAPRWRRADQPPAVQRLAWLACAEPRRRLGGTGTPCYEVMGYTPWFDRGLPTSWVKAFDEAYRNGRARDVDGRPIGTEFHEGQFPGRPPDPADPPTFESEAAYLARHHLLTPAERRRLTPAAFAPVAIAIEDRAA